MKLCASDLENLKIIPSGPIPPNPVELLASKRFKKLLDQLQKKYTSYNTIEADFTLTIEIPEEDEEIQKGTIIQNGEKYRLDIEGQCIVSDGTTLV